MIRVLRGKGCFIDDDEVRAQAFSVIYPALPPSHIGSYGLLGLVLESVPGSIEYRSTLRSLLIFVTVVSCGYFLLALVSDWLHVHHDRDPMCSDPYPSQTPYTPVCQISSSHFHCC